MSDIPQRPNADEIEESQKETSSSFVGFSVFTGVIAIVTSYAALLIDLSSGEYGGVGLMALICLGVPAGVFGMLGGFVWHKIKRKSRLAPNLIPLILVGLVTGIIPFICIKLLPQ